MKKIILFGLAFALAFFGTSTLIKKCSTPTEDNPSEGAQQTDHKGWVSLFDGVSFKGWHNYGTDSISSQWQVLDGTMVFSPDSTANNAGLNNLVTDKEYSSFILSVDWKISAGGNSGIFWAVQENETYSVPYQTGPEIQVLDNLKHPDAAYANHRAGSLYDMITPSQEVVKEVGQWNTCVISINHHTNKGSVRLNGIEIVNFPVSGDEWEAMIANSKFKDWQGFGLYKSGRIGLQDHHDEVAYRNLTIKEL